MKTKTQQLVLTAIITAMALASYTIEAAIPPLTPVYGIKLGIANIFTIFTLYALGTPQAAAVLLLRIVLGNIFTGQIVSLIYSLAGGLLSFAVMLILKRFFNVDKIWALSVISAAAHNTGQIIAAVAVTGTPQIAYYLPVLIISGIISGALTGICAQLVLKRLLHINLTKR